MNSKYIAIALAVIALLFIAWLYLLIKSKTTDVSKEQPFNDLISHKLTTKRKAIIALNPENSTNETYPYVLEDNSNYGIDNLAIIAEIPLGTEITIHSTKLKKGGVSGTTTAYVYGNIQIKNKDYPFSYAWGNHHWLNEEKPYWTFPLSVWQDEALKDNYFLKEL